MQMFKQLMIDFDFQFASRTRNKRKLSVLSIVKTFDKFLCGIAREVGLPPDSEVPSQPFRGGHDHYDLDNCKFIVSYMNSHSFFYKWEGLTKIPSPWRFALDAFIARSNAHVVSSRAFVTCHSPYITSFTQLLLDLQHHLESQLRT